MIPIAARAQDAQSQQPVLDGISAVEVTERLDYDFGKLNLLQYETMAICIRTAKFDVWTADFLSRHPDALVVHIGCGLDDRLSRVLKSRPSNAMWIDVDLPEVVELRSKIMPITHPGIRYEVMGADITTDSWLSDIPRTRPTIIVMEGVMSYLTQSDSRALLRRISSHFGQGEILLECISSTLLAGQDTHSKRLHDMGARLKSSVDEVKLLEEKCEGLLVVEELPFCQAPGIECLPWKFRLRMYLVSWFPNARDLSRFLRLEFGAGVRR